MTDDLLERLHDGVRFNTANHEYDTDAADADMEESAKRIEALTAEREDLIECNEQFSVDNQFLKKRAEKAEADNARLRAALEPFASALKGNWSHQPDGTKILCGTSEFDLRLNLTLGDFRRAAAAINTGKEPSQ